MKRNRWGGLNRQPCELAADVAAALMWGPKTAHEVREIVAPTTRSTALARKYCEQFVVAGCAYVSALSKKGAPIYAWNDKPFAKSSIPTAAVSATQPTTERGTS